MKPSKANRKDDQQRDAGMRKIFAWTKKTSGALHFVPPLHCYSLFLNTKRLALTGGFDWIARSGGWLWPGRS